MAPCRIEVLLDGGGDDTYEFDYISHGGGYWFAAGFARDFGGNDQRLGATAEPLARRLVAVEVVPAGTIDVVGAGVGALERGHPGGHGRLPHELVHPSVDRCDAGAAVVEFTPSLLQREGSAWVTEMPVPSRWST